MGSLSLLAHQPLPGYEPLPDFPQEQPDTSVRDVEELEGWSGSRTVVMETGFGSDSFDNSYRGGRGASTALSGIEAMGSSSMYSPSASTMKKKGNDYDLDAFYDESSDEEESSSSSEEESETSEEESEENGEGEGSEDDDEEEEETDLEESSGLSSSEEEEPVKLIRKK